MSKKDMPVDQDVSGEWTKERGEAVLREAGLGGVLGEPESPMSRFYVTQTFTEYGNPLKPFRERLALAEGESLREKLDALALEDARSSYEEDERVTRKPRRTLSLRFVGACSTALTLTARRFLRACRVKPR